jgi:transposase
LCTVPGVGALVAGSFVSVVDDAKRFRDAHSVESYLGLVPSEHSSGGSKQRLGAITKHGNCYARAMLVQAAWSLMTRGPLDDPMRRWAQAVAERRGKRIAVIALARRLVGVLWAMWRDNTAYDPALAGRASVRGLRCQAQSLEERTKILERALRKRSAAKLADKPCKNSAHAPGKRSATKRKEVPANG